MVVKAVESNLILNKQSFTFGAFLHFMFFYVLFSLLNGSCVAFGKGYKVCGNSLFSYLAFFFFGFLFSLYLLRKSIAFKLINSKKRLIVAAIYIILLTIIYWLSLN